MNEPQLTFLPVTESIPVDEVEDPRTTFRQTQAQDVVLWSGTIYESYVSRATKDKDPEAIAWVLSDSTEKFSFLACCSIFGIDSDAIRDSITNSKQFIREEDHEQ